VRARAALDANELCEFPIKPAHFIVRRILSHASARTKRRPDLSACGRAPLVGSQSHRTARDTISRLFAIRRQSKFYWRAEIINAQR
jgi:hypothetical protein